MGNVRTIEERKKELNRKLEELNLRDEIEAKKKKLKELRGKKR
jgi:hypothetical protein